MRKSVVAGEGHKGCSEHIQRLARDNRAVLKGLCSQLIRINSASANKVEQSVARHSGAELAGLDELLVVLARLIIIGVAVLFAQETAGLLILLIVALGMLDWPGSVSGGDARSRRNQRQDLQV